MDKHEIDTDQAIAEIEGRQPDKAEPAATNPKAMPAAGPHAKDSLTRHEATPGAGSLPDTSPEVDGGAG